MSENGTEALLTVDDLHVHFDSDDGVVKAVDGISYEVRTGEVLGIVGESGSGKSVSSLSIMGLTRGKRTRITGSATFDGRDLLGMSNAELRTVRGGPMSMIFQDPLSSLHPFYKVGKQLVEAIQTHQPLGKAQARQRAVDLLGQVGIPDPKRRVDEYPHEFSGGMRQRAMIAMGLANEPKLLIADEPTTALDVTVQAQILDVLGKLNQELGMAMILITHDLGVVAEVADQIAVMYAGRIVEQAPAQRLFAAPQHPYTWGLLRSIPRLDSPREVALEPIPGRPPSLITLPGGCAFHPRCAFVRDRHKTVEPRLEPSPDHPAHRVACLLEASERRALWDKLERGRGVVEAAEEVDVPVTPPEELQAESDDAAPVVAETAGDEEPEA